MMKKNKLLKTAHILAASLMAVAALTAISCSDISAAEENKTEQVQSQKSVLRIKLADDSARTIFPKIPLDSLGNFRLTGKVGSSGEPIAFGVTEGDSSTKKTSFTKEELEKTIFTLPNNSRNKEWIFTLTASKLDGEGNATDVEYTAQKTITIQEGENPVKFAFEVTPFGTGTGSLSVKFDWTKDTVNAKKVTNVDISLLPLLNPEGDENQTLPAEHHKVYSRANSDFSASNSVVTYSESNVTAWAYNLVANFMADTETVAYWEEVIYIADGLSSTAERKIDSLSNIYHLTYSVGSDVTNPCPQTVTSSSELFPENNGIRQAPTRTGYTFIDWYTDAACTKVFVIKDITSDTTLYAKWISDSDPNVATRITLAEKIRSAPKTTADSPTTIQVLGTFTKEDFADVNEALLDNNYENIHISLDFSEVTGLTELPSYCLADCGNLVAIILPETITTIRDGVISNTGITKLTIPASVKYIYSNALVSAHKLSNIQVDSANENYKSIDGVLYNKDVTKLIAYPAEREIENYKTPTSVTTIGSYAFSYENKVQNVIVGANVNHIEEYGFYYFRNYKSLQFEDSESIWYGPGYSNLEEAVNNGTPCTSQILSEWFSDAPSYGNFWKNSGETFADLVEKAIAIPASEIYPTGTYDLATDYTFVDFSLNDGATMIYWYSIPTTPGKRYQIYFCNWYGYSKNCFECSNPSIDTENFNYSGLDCYDKSGKHISCDGENYAYDFVADTNTTYIRLKENWGKIAFRLVTPTTKASVKDSDDILINIESDDASFDLSKAYPSEDLIHADTYDNRVYYFDLGRKIDDENQFCYLDGELQNTKDSLTVTTKGLHVLTIEAVIDGRRYSYSKQINVE